MRIIAVPIKENRQNNINMVVSKRQQKKRVVTSIDRLSEELQNMFNELYPKKDDIERSLIRLDRPDGTFICCVPFETDDTSYLIKIKVEIDKNPEETYADPEEEEVSEDEASGEDMKGADELADQADEEDEESN